jgi:hypothetical protein
VLFCLYSNSDGKVLQRFSAGTGTQILKENMQRGLQRFFGQILTIYSRFCSILFTLRHSLKTVFPRVPRLSVAGYVVKKIVSPKETVHKHNEALCNSLAFHLCISPFILSTFASYFGIVLLAKAPQNAEN